MLLRSGLTGRDDSEDNAQNILEEHVSRVWDRSLGTTPPTRTPAGLRTPNQHRGVRNNSGAARGSKSGRTRDDGFGPVPVSSSSGGVGGVGSRHSHPHRHASQPPGNNAVTNSSGMAGAQVRRSHGFPTSAAAVVTGSGLTEHRTAINSRRTFDAGHLLTSVAGGSRQVVPVSAGQDLHQPSNVHAPEVTTERYFLKYVHVC